MWKTSVISTAEIQQIIKYDNPIEGQDTQTSKLDQEFIKHLQLCILSALPI